MSPWVIFEAKCLPTADRYEGEWRGGLENGVGTFIAADGSTYNGPWANGKMHGQGVEFHCQELPIYCHVANQSFGGREGQWKRL